MAPKPAALESALVDATKELFRIDYNTVTVNVVRKHAEDQLGLEEGFFKSDAWKNRSKKVITTLVSELLEKKDQAEEGEENGTASKSRASSVLSDVDGNRKRDAEEVDRKSKKRKSGGGRPTKTKDNQQADHVSEKPLPVVPAAPAEVHDDSDGSSTSVLADTPPPKRKSKSSKQAAPKHAPAKHGSAKPAAHKAAAASSPEEEEIKKLQSHLVKCGVRKIWGFELKSYGDDAKAKIRHLKGMLHDVGMDGRFSESRAREIKERRELMADLEEVQEMNRNWGVKSSGRASRSRAAKNLKEESSDGEAGQNGDAEDSEEDAGKKTANKHSHDDDDDDEEEEEDLPQAKARSRQSARQADLAFLGSESESDSD